MVATQTLFFQKLAEMTDLNYLKSYLTYLVSPVITGIKPLSLLNLQNNHRPLVLMWEQEGEDFLQKHQLEQYVVKKSNKTLKLFIYNKSILERYLRKPHNLHFLRQFGYSGNAPLEEYLSYLKIRWKDSTFPHES
ncbi:MAG: DUF3793 family protein, partial [Epulopiscium sp.]|nr:DUF3793 family protein [Candidatus Epulonipiscium sp.]